MLGGSFWAAVIRNSMGAGLMLSVFLLLDRPRFSMKKTVCTYILFGLLASLAFSVWYLLDRGNYIRFAGMLVIPVIGIFCIKMSWDTLYLSLYKLALGFYFLALSTFFSIDISRILFGGNIWADIVIRIQIIAVVLIFIALKVRDSFLDGIDYLREEMDWFSAVTVVLSILIAALVAFWPGTRELSRMRVFRIFFLLFMAGVIQYLVFRVYLHKGKEHRYQLEKELLETNARLIERQMELMRESKEELARIRHDVRHHCLLLEEYLRNGENEKMLAYVKRYREELESGGSTKPSFGMHCNETVNNILSAYTRRAREKNIEVAVCARLEGNIPVKDIDLVAVIANIFENAIHGCCMSPEPEKKIQVSVTRKENKIVIQCRNTCAPDVKLKHGLPVSSKKGGTGILSILKVVSFYNGEVEFAVEQGMFVVRILLNIPKEASG